MDASVSGSSKVAIEVSTSGYWSKNDPSREPGRVLHQEKVLERVSDLGQLTMPVRNSSIGDETACSKKGASVRYLWGFASLDSRAESCHRP